MRDVEEVFKHLVTQLNLWHLEPLKPRQLNMIDIALWEILW